MLLNLRKLLEKEGEAKFTQHYMILTIKNTRKIKHSTLPHLVAIGYKWPSKCRTMHLFQNKYTKEKLKSTFRRQHQYIFSIQEYFNRRNSKWLPPKYSKKIQKELMPSTTMSNTIFRPCLKLDKISI